jgi:hypothetical protein
MSLARTLDWKQSVDPDKCRFVLENLRELSSPTSDSVLREILSDFTNIAFRDEAVARSWVGVWVQLLESELKPTEDMGVNAWLSEHQFETFAQPKSAQEIPDIKLCYSGTYESSVDGREWKKIGNPSNGLRPFDSFCRFIGDPTIDDWDLISLAQLSVHPGLVDLRLSDCNALTDEVIGIIANVKTLQVLSIGSLQITGKTIAGLRDLPNLRRLDLSGCTNLEFPIGIDFPGCTVYRSDR